MALPKLNAPKYTMTIPSTGFDVEYRPYLVREEKLLMIAMESEDEKQMVAAIRDIIESCTFNQVDINNLATFDIDYMFIKLRSKSVGESSTVQLTCTNCEHKNEYTVNLDNDVKVKKSPEKKIELTADTGLIMRHISMADYIDVVNSGKNFVDQQFDLIAKSIDSVYSGDEVFDVADQTDDEIIEFLESLNSEQFIKVKSFIENTPHAYANVAYKCESCGTEHEFELKGLRNFFS